MIDVLIQHIADLNDELGKIYDRYKKMLEWANKKHDKAAEALEQLTRLPFALRFFTWQTSTSGKPNKKTEHGKAELVPFFTAATLPVFFSFLPSDFGVCWLPCGGSLVGENGLILFSPQAF